MDASEVELAAVLLVELERAHFFFVNEVQFLPAPAVAYPLLDSETYDDARTVAPGYDVYYLEEEWRQFWVASGRPELKNPDAAFIGFCKSRHERKPVP